MPILNIKDPAVLVYTGTAVWLSLHMTLLDAYSGATRAKTKTVVNPEDSSTVAKGADVVKSDPDAVARVLRAHRNLTANAVPFLIMGLVWTLLGAPVMWLAGVCGVFVVARLIHSFMYVGEKQPGRTISFVIGQLAMATMAVQLIRAIIGGLTG